MLITLCGYYNFLFDCLGMLIESMAGKSAAVHGEFQDGTAFQFHEENRAVDHIGDQLKYVYLYLT